MYIADLLLTKLFYILSIVAIANIAALRRAYIFFIKLHFQYVLYWEFLH